MSQYRPKREGNTRRYINLGENRPHFWGKSDPYPTWRVPATELHVRAGALELCLENVGLSGSAEDHGTYEMVRENRSMGDDWRARHPQRWRVRLLAPFRGEGSASHVALTD